MAHKIPVDSRIRAAVHAAHFERWRKLYSRSPVFAPRNLENMLPEPVSAVPSLIEAATKDDHRRQVRGEERLVRSAACTLARVKAEPTLAQLLSGSGRWAIRRADGRTPVQQQPTSTRRAKKTAKVNATSAPEALEVPASIKLPDSLRLDGAGKPETHARGCCCAVLSSARNGPTSTPVVHHRSGLTFDPDTFISEAMEYVVFEADLNAASAVIEAAKPWNWAESDDDAEDFFKKSVVADADGVPWRKQPTEMPHGTFYLLEGTSWQVNRGLTGESEILLAIEGAETRTEGYTTGLNFDYRLRECRETQFFVARSRGGISVDEGCTQIQWVEPTDDSGLGRLHVFATKRLRFQATREITGDQALLLNMLAPATLSVLMQSLALDTPLELIGSKVPTASLPAAVSAA